MLKTMLKCDPQKKKKNTNLIKSSIYNYYKVLPTKFIEF